MKKARKPVSDGGNLWLMADESGPRSWAFRYMLAGRAREMGLGPVYTVDLDDARQLAANARRLLLDGVDPIDDRERRRLDAKATKARLTTFRQCADAFLADHKGTWKNAKHRQQWANTLDTYAHPVIGDLAVGDVTTDLVLKVIRPIWHDKPETASRVRGRIEKILSWATTSGHRTGDNPARWKGHLQNLLPARSRVRAVRHHPALPYAELPAFMAQLREREGVSARALEVTILTALRTTAAIGAKWPEIDVDAKCWTVPPERVKHKPGEEPQPHRIPLPDQVVAILNDLPREKGNPFVFIGGKAGKSLSNMAMLELLDEMGFGQYTVHGFRSTFKDWASEVTKHPDIVVEMALAHAISDDVEKAYRRGDLYAKRTKLMADRARYALSPVPAGNVLPMQRAAR